MKKTKNKKTDINIYILKLNLNNRYFYIKLKNSYLKY